MLPFSYKIPSGVKHYCRKVRWQLTSESVIVHDVILYCLARCRNCIKIWPRVDLSGLTSREMALPFDMQVGVHPSLGNIS